MTGTGTGIGTPPGKPGIAGGMTGKMAASNTRDVTHNSSQMSLTPPLPRLLATESTYGPCPPLPAYCDPPPSLPAYWPQSLHTRLCKRRTHRPHHRSDRGHPCSHVRASSAYACGATTTGPRLGCANFVIYLERLRGRWAGAGWPRRACRAMRPRERGLWPATRAPLWMATWQAGRRTTVRWPRCVDRTGS
jgi:hypothetical protein